MWAQEMLILYYAHPDFLVFEHLYIYNQNEYNIRINITFLLYYIYICMYYICIIYAYICIYIYYGMCIYTFIQYTYI